MKPLAGIHHVTAIAGNPQPNHEFYTKVLGLRLVKKTVNFDDPGTYHLYYGNGSGAPGTIITFFPWPGIQQGRRGTAQATEIQLRVPQGSLPYWVDRLDQHNVIYNKPAQRLDGKYLVALDPDGLKLELVEAPTGPNYGPYEDGGIPADAAIQGIFGVTLSLERSEGSARVLTEGFGYQKIAEEGNRIRFSANGDPNGDIVDLVSVPGEHHGWVAGGTVHHVAFRAKDDDDQDEIRARLIELGMSPTERLDRNYFHSIYFREPGHVLFEVATDPPGFAADEDADRLGSHLKLPAWLEPRREELEHILPRL